LHWAEHSCAKLTQVVRNQPIGRLGTADEVAAALLWLCSPGASFVVEAALAVAGDHVSAAVVIRGDERWSLHGAPWSQSVAISGKCDRHRSDQNKRNPLPWVATVAETSA
jgi:hypothetical protein